MRGAALCNAGSRGRRLHALRCAEFKPERPPFRTCAWSPGPCPSPPTAPWTSSPPQKYEEGQEYEGHFGEAPCCQQTPCAAACPAPPDVRAVVVVVSSPECPPPPTVVILLTPPLYRYTEGHRQWWCCHPPLNAPPPPSVSPPHPTPPHPPPPPPQTNKYCRLFFPQGGHRQRRQPLPNCGWGAGQVGSGEARVRRSAKSGRSERRWGRASLGVALPRLMAASAHAAASRTS